MRSGVAEMARLLEHHALDLLKQEGIPIPAFRVVSAPGAAKEVAIRLGCPVVLKALIVVGGRGKAGAIKMAYEPEEAFEQAQQLLGRTVLNFPVNELLVSEAVKIQKEFFVSLTFDSMSRKPVVLFSSLGGVDVEEILVKDPDRLVQTRIDIGLGLQPFQAREMAESTGLAGKILLDAAEILPRLYRIFRQFDCQTVEINPLVLTDAGQLIAPSAVIVIDNQALFRHPELEGIADPDRTNGWRPLTPLEKEMRAIDRTDSSSAIRFNEFDSGDIAFMITGGGAGLLAFDSILQLGGRPSTAFDITPGGSRKRCILPRKPSSLSPGSKE